MQWFLENRPDLARAHRLHASARRRRHGPAAAGDPVARAAGARAALHARRERVPLALRHPLAVAGPRRRTPTSSTSTGEEYRVDYVPGESNTGLFGGNSNWRGPVWFPVNYLLIEALERYHHFYGDDLRGRVPDRLGPDAEPERGRRGSWRRAGAALPARRARAPPLPRRRRAATPTIPTGGTWCCSTSTSTATPGGASAPATRPGGPRWSCAASRT